MTCKICDNKSGQSILLVRPTAVATDPAIAPQGIAALDAHAGTVKTFGLPPLKAESKYALRLLRREGYVYVFFPGEKPLGQIKPWLAYRVYNQGALIPEGSFVFDRSEFACSTKSTHPHDVRTLCIAEPKRIAKVWVGFSMNWWSDTVKSNAAKDPKAAGMVEVNLAGDPPTHGFAADAALLKQHVADYAVQSLKHGGLEEDATPFYPPGDIAAAQAARALVAVMQRQNAGHASKPMVVAIPDPVGLAADLNGIRMARDRRDKEALLLPEVAWPLMTNQLLSGLKASIESAAMDEARATPDGHVSQKRWNELKGTPFYREGGYEWLPTQGTAADGSPNGKAIKPRTSVHERRIDERGNAYGSAQWKPFASQIDAGKHERWMQDFKTRRGTEADRLALHEKNWLAAVNSSATLAYFATHFDESDPNKHTAPTSPGAIYAGESHLIHYPQPLSTAECYAQYLERMLEPPITDPHAVPLRAMFGNQKDVISRVHAMLIGDADRDNEDNMRDKTLDIFKGLVTAEWGPKYSWMKAAVMGLSGGHLAAVAAGALQFGLSLKWSDGLTIPQKAQKYLQRLPALAAAELALLDAMRAATEGGAPGLHVVIRSNWRREKVLAIMERNPFDYSEADRRAIRNKPPGSMIVAQRVVMLDAGSANIRLIPNETAQLPGASPRSRRGLSMAQFTEHVKAADLQSFDSATVKNVKAHVAQEAVDANVKSLRTDQFFGGAVMVVQGLGLIWSMRDFFQELGKGDNSKLFDKLLGVADGVAGFVGGALDLRAANLQIQMVEAQGAARGTAMSQVSRSLSNLRAGAAMTGVAGGVLNMVMSFRKMQEADQKGDEASYRGHLYAGIAFGLNSVAMSLITADFLTRGATNRAIGAASQKVAQTLIKRGLQRVVLTVIASASAEALVAGVGVFISGAGWVLLIAGVASTMWAVLSERSDLQRWIARGYFGRDTEGRYEEKGRELLEYHMIMAEMVYKPMADEENQRLLKKYPGPPAAPAPRIPPFGGDGVGGFR